MERQHNPLTKQHNPLKKTYTGPGFVFGSNNTVGRKVTNGGLAGAEFGNEDTLEELKKKRVKIRRGKINDKRPVAKPALKVRNLPRPQPGPIKEGINEDELDPNQRALLRRMRRKAS